MPTKEELTESIKAVGDEIRALKAAKAEKDAVMAKVASMTALKAQYQEVAGEPFDPPSSGSSGKKGKKEKKADAAPAAAASAEGEGPSKNELKKLAKAAKKDAKRAAYKDGSTEPAAPSAEAAPAAAAGTSKPAAGAPAAAASGKTGRSVAAPLNLPPPLPSSSPSSAPAGLPGLVGATLHFHPATAQATAFALATHPAQRTGLALAQAAAPHELARLVLGPGLGGGQVVGDHAIARLVMALGGGSSGSGGAAAAVAASRCDQWVDLAAMFGGDELSPLLPLIDAQLACTSFLGPEPAAPGLADAAVYGCLALAAGNDRQQLLSLTRAHPNVARWAASLVKSPSMQLAAQILSGTAAAPPPQKKEGGGGEEEEEGGGGGGGDDVGGCPPLEGAVMGEVVTRFPPEPSGYLHIGHAKAVMLNEYYARRYKGKLLVRFDDTNPSKEKEEFEANILKDLETMGVKPDLTSHSSDHFPKCEELAKKMLLEGKAYMDDTDQETMREERANRVLSKRRDQSPKEALAIFEKLLKGDKDFVQWCMRAKLDMGSDNGTLRDPVLYRYNGTPHHRTGTRHKAYPTYDFVCPIVDALEGVTHCLRSTEFNDRNPQYHALQATLGLRRVHIWEYGKVNFVHTVLSKRKLQWFVDNCGEGHPMAVEGWFDPRFPTVQGCIRRGVTMEGLRKFVYAQGASRNIVWMEWDKFWSFNKESFEKTAPRYMGVAQAKAVPLRLSGGDAAFPPDCDGAAITVAFPACAPRPMRVGRTVRVEAEDAALCTVGAHVILLQWGVVEITEVVRGGADGQQVVGLAGTRLPDASVKKLKLKFNWVAESPDLVVATVKEYDHLITKPKLEDGDKVEEHLNPRSQGRMAMLVEPAMAALPEGAIVQLMRRGFFRVDRALCADGGGGRLELVLIPDGKAKSMSTLSTALPHH